MKNTLILLLVVAGFAMSQNSLVGRPASVMFLKGSPTAGVTYTNGTFDSSATFSFANVARLALRLRTNDSTYVVVSLWKRENLGNTVTWTATDSITIHPASGAAADTVWTLRNHATDLPKGAGTLYQFQYRFAASGNWVTQAVASSLRIWLEYSGY